MNFLGIIAEYNPFHNGHKYHIQESKKALNPDAVIVVMSGNFTQRGNLACYDKWTRTKCALLNGADLVIELPVSFATGSAERFAFGGISLLDKIGVTNISFGAESQLCDLENIAEKLLSDSFVIDTPSEIPFHIARQKAISDNNILSLPNNILAVEYIKSLKLLNSDITPYCIERHGAGYKDMTINDGFTSATKVRDIIKHNQKLDNVVPENVYNILKESKFTDDEQLFSYIKYAIISKSIDELAGFAHIREGIENRIYKSVFCSNSLDELVKNIKSKRYTYTSISRMLISVLLGIKKENLSVSPEYIRVLGLNDTGAQALKHIKKHCPLPVITKVSSTGNLSPTALQDLEYDLKAGDIYYSCTNLSCSARPDYTNSPVKV